MPKPYRLLIVIWTLVCASGLAVFLFQVFYPVIPIAAEEKSVPFEALAYWFIIWIVPVIILVAAGRRHKG